MKDLWANLMKSNTKKGKQWLLYGVIALVVLGLGALIYVNKQLSPVQSTQETVIFEIEQGASTRNILSDLESEKVIRSASFARYYMSITSDVNFKAGRFEVDRSWSTPKILKFLSHVDNLSDEALVRIPDGSWAKDIAKQLSSISNHKPKDFIDAWNDKTYLKTLVETYQFLPDTVLTAKDTRVRLEGFLYPDTYRFNPTDSVETITEKMLDNAARHFDPYLAAMEKSSLSKYELYTLASIVDYEAVGFDDQSLVAGVFMNRLEKDMKLGASVTVCYALYEFDSWVECEKKQPDSPYNTYLYAGLPPGPIRSISEGALKATIKFQSHDYLFFIADVCGDGTLYPAVTFAEHQANIDKYLKDCY